MFDTIEISFCPGTSSTLSAGPHGHGYMTQPHQPNAGPSSTTTTASTAATSTSSSSSSTLFPSTSSAAAAAGGGLANRLVSHRPAVFDKLEQLVKDMQDDDHGVPVRSQKLFLTSIPAAFMGKTKHDFYYRAFYCRVIK